MNRLEALRRVIEHLTAAANVAHQTDLVQLGLAIQSALYEVQQVYWWQATGCVVRGRP